MLLLTALSLVFRRQFLAFAGTRLVTVTPGRTALLTVLTGVVLGVLVTISSVGAGAIGVTILLLLYPRLPMAIIVGSDIAHAVPLTLVAGVGHWFLGSVDWSLLTSLLTGSVPGVILGSYLAARVPDAVLRPVLAVTLVLSRRPTGVLNNGAWSSTSKMWRAFGYGSDVGCASYPWRNRGSTNGSPRRPRQGCCARMVGEDGRTDHRTVSTITSLVRLYRTAERPTPSYGSETSKNADGGDDRPTAVGDRRIRQTTPDPRTAGPGWPRSRQNRYGDRSSRTVHSRTNAGPSVHRGGSPRRPTSAKVMTPSAVSSADNPKTPNRRGRTIA